jgi:hypothetical protein
MWRVSRHRGGELKIEERGGRGVWVCSNKHQIDLVQAVRIGLRGPVGHEEAQLIARAYHRWADGERERRGA